MTTTSTDPFKEACRNHLEACKLFSERECQEARSNHSEARKQFSERECQEARSNHSEARKQFSEREFQEARNNHSEARKQFSEREFQEACERFSDRLRVAIAVLKLMEGATDGSRDRSGLWEYMMATESVIDCLKVDYAAFRDVWTNVDKRIN